MQPKLDMSAIREISYINYLERAMLLRVITLTKSQYNLRLITKRPTNRHHYFQSFDTNFCSVRLIFGRLESAKRCCWFATQHEFPLPNEYDIEMDRYICLPKTTIYGYSSWSEKVLLDNFYWPYFRLTSNKILSIQHVHRPPLSDRPVAPTRVGVRIGNFTL